ncbi:MAG: carboxypeptidase regulatory-like domain-containing protein [Candidatus Eisenbacteria bacterium]|uniref:Carboxypeptidase regulatory-like domain-containing protein n=1 Tax=Eiseniibacteriota bacterium TaxID=2212470 RepID=A0A956SFH6_UNCEI|nr:carboxypeptidase regulatory-like domain-containing protein [Candidatus Eisenbacteria bacterium]
MRPRVGRHTEPRSPIRRVPVPLVLLAVIALLVSSCGDEPTKSRSDQAWVHLLLTRADSTAFDTSIRVRPYVPTAPGFPVEATIEAGIADLYLAPGDYVFELPEVGYLSKQGDVLLDWESVIHLDPGEDRVIEGHCAGVELELRDSVTGELLDPDEIHGRFYLNAVSRSFRPRSIPIEHGVLLGELAVGTYDQLVFVPTEGSEYVRTWFPGSPTAEHAVPLSIPPTPVQRRQFSLIPAGHLEVTWSAPLPEGWTCSYTLSSGVSGDPLSSGTGDRVVLDGLTVGEPIDILADLTWTSPEQTASTQSRVRIPDFQTVPGDTVSVHLDFQYLEVRDSGCFRFCPRIVEASSSYQSAYETATWNGDAPHGARLLFRAASTARRVHLDTSVYASPSLKSYWPGVLIPWQREALELAPGEPMIVWLDAVAGGTLRGRVVGSDGETLPTLVSQGSSISVQVFHDVARWGPIEVEASSFDSDGGFSISGVPPGDCKIVIRVGFDGEYRDTWWPSAEYSEDAGALTVHEGDKIHDLEVRLQRR